jgi:hypothetical protein
MRDTRWFKYDRDKLWLVYTQIVPVLFEPPCITAHTNITHSNVTPRPSLLSYPGPLHAFHIIFHSHATRPTHVMMAQHIHFSITLQYNTMHNLSPSWARKQPQNVLTDASSPRDKATMFGDTTNETLYLRLNNVRTRIFPRLSHFPYILILSYICDALNDAVDSEDCRKSSGRLFKGELERMWKETVVTYSEVASRCLREEDCKNCSRSRSQSPVCGPRLEPTESWIRMTNAHCWTVSSAYLHFDIASTVEVNDRCSAVSMIRRR